MVAGAIPVADGGFEVTHLRLVIGISMGGMHTWLWGESYPDFMDALMPLACLPTQISGRIASGGALSAMHPQRPRRGMAGNIGGNRRACEPPLR